MSSFVETAEDAANDGDYLKSIAFSLMAIRDELWTLNRSMGEGPDNVLAKNLDEIVKRMDDYE